MPLTAEEKVNGALTRLTSIFPFFGAFCLRCNVQEFDEAQYKMMEKMNGRATMATDGKNIWWGRDFVNEMTVSETTGVIMHEILHIVYKHPFRRRHREPQKWNVANDYVIDPMVLETAGKKSSIALPPHKGEGYHNHHELKYDGMSSEEVYELLPDQPPQKGMGVVLDATGENGQPLSDSEISAAEMEIDQLAIIGEELQKRKNDGIGSLPGGLLEHLKKLKEPKVDWRSVLRRFTGGEQPDAHSMRRPHRSIYRMEQVFAPTITKKGVGELVIAIDTSASVSDDEVEQFLGEMNIISEEFRPAKITLIQCDAKVQSVEEYEPGNIIDSIKCTGRGGTRVRPVFSYVEKNIEKVDRLIYMTDMGIDDWGHPPGYPVLWVGTCNTQPPWGEFVYVNINQR